MNKLLGFSFSTLFNFPITLCIGIVVGLVLGTGILLIRTGIYNKHLQKSYNSSNTKGLWNVYLYYFFGGLTLFAGTACVIGAFIGGLYVGKFVLTILFLILSMSVIFLMIRLTFPRLKKRETLLGRRNR